MKNIALRLLSVFVLTALALNFTSCKKIKKGVIEVRSATLVLYMAGIGSSNGNWVWEDFYVIPADDDISLSDGEHVVISSGDLGPSGLYYRTEYVYHEHESAKSLGYTVISKEDPKETPYGSCDYNFQSEFGSGAATPGENSSFDFLVGTWKHEPSGLQIWIDNVNNGNAVLINGGTSAPDEAVGGYAWREINSNGDNTYTFHNQTFYDGAWYDASYMTLELAEDGQTFTINGVEYIRTY